MMFVLLLVYIWYGQRLLFSINKKLVSWNEFSWFFLRLIVKIAYSLNISNLLRCFWIKFNTFVFFHIWKNTNICIKIGLEFVPLLILVALLVIFYVQKKGWEQSLSYISLILPPYRNLSIDLQCKSFDWFPYECNIGLTWVKVKKSKLILPN